METKFKIFIGGLSKKAKEPQLVNHLQKYGRVISLDIKRKPTTGDCVGYGHATVEKDTYLKLINKGCSKFKGRKITFGPYLEGNHLKSHLQKLNSKRIFVRNVPGNSTATYLEQFFSVLGVVETAYLRSFPGARTPIGVIMFINPTVAEQAAQIINEDKEGVFKFMTATYKFLHSREGTNEHNKQEPSQEAEKKFLKLKSESSLTKSFDAKPGKMGYEAYDQTEKNHNFGNLMLNVGGKNTKIRDYRQSFSSYENYCYVEDKGYEYANDCYSMNKKKWSKIQGIPTSYLVGKNSIYEHSF